jgi:hypothetical protein
MSSGTFKPVEMWVLSWILLVDVVTTIASFGHWSPRLYSQAFNSSWLSRWFKFNRRPM